MSDHGEAKLRAGAGVRRFEQSPRVCVYGCPGLCLTKCIQAGECVVGFATYAGRGVVEDVGKELDVIELAGRLSDIYNLCESDAARMDLARLMVARGIRVARDDNDATGFKS